MTYPHPILAARDIKEEIKEEADEDLSGHVGDTNAPAGEPDDEPVAEHKADDIVWTYTIITVPAAPTLRWLHDRMPAVLETQEEVSSFAPEWVASIFMTPSFSD